MNSDIDSDKFWKPTPISSSDFFPQRNPTPTPTPANSQILIPTPTPTPPESELESGFGVQRRALPTTRCLPFELAASLSSRD